MSQQVPTFLSGAAIEAILNRAERKHPQAWRRKAWQIGHYPARYFRI
jgi:hypothetical protein